MTPVKTAKIKFNEHGMPYSTQFKDIYFDHSISCLQSEQVFINGNNLVQVWHDLHHNNDETEFVIAETGFGTGLNFLLTLEKFRQFKQQSGNTLLRLKFISCEKYPLSRQDLQQALALWPQYQHDSEILLNQYIFNDTALTSMSFLDGLVNLEIYFCDATQAFQQIDVIEHSLVDAWYLDGFAPSCNNDMWSDELFSEVARLAKLKSSLATFTVASLVKKGLAKVGYKIQKQKSSLHTTDAANKTETLSAIFLGERKGKPLNGFKRRNAINIEKPKHVSIIGGGLASACSALALAKKGIHSVIYCQDKDIAQGASGNAVGAIYPLLHQEQDTISKFYQLGFEHALKTYHQLLNDGYAFGHGFDGLIDVSYKDALVKRQQVFSEKNAWPHNLIHGINSEQVDSISNIKVGHPGLFMPRAGWVCPPELVNAMMHAAVDTGFCKIKTNRHIKHITQLDNGRWLIQSNKEQKQVQHLVICAGADSLKIDVLNDLPLSQVRGQVSQMQTNAKVAPLQTVLCHKGYLTPQYNNNHCIGATFDKDDGDIESRPQDDVYNVDMLEKCLGDITNFNIDDVQSSKARLRCCTPDHLPMVGQLPNIALHKQYYQHLSKDKNWHFAEPTPIHQGLYVLTGLGARGLCSAPLLADILVAEICDDHYPVDEEMLFNLSPNRFIIRDLIKRK